MEVRTKLPRPHQWQLGLLAITILILAFAIFQVILQRADSYTYNGLPYDPPEMAADFLLIDQNNEPFRLSDHRGEVILLYFGFTHCPEACPLTLGVWNQVYDMLGSKASDVQFVFITIDPERDTPDQIAQHLSLFNPAFIGLTGSLAEIEDVATDYSVFFQKVEPETSGDYYLVNHTTLVFLIDQDGYLNLAFPYATGAQEILSDLEHLLE